VGMEDGAAALGAVALAVDGRPLAQDDEAPIDMLGGVTTSTNFSLEPASAVSASSAPTTSADDDEAPSELLALLLEEWPDLMELVLAQLVGPGRYCRACNSVLHISDPRFLS
jgi:hypothetical protein